MRYLVKDVRQDGCLSAGGTRDRLFKQELTLVRCVCGAHSDPSLRARLKVRDHGARHLLEVVAERRVTSGLICKGYRVLT